ncbi:hypothetical protein DBV15_07473 [Temnothorax longispinosus]|uniref:Uncharacterized protein n=1 Tax=Temnothorax longispinosus TaxID=300112 RepID=A0A4S2KIL5_9HYME|nr:hypothetical protein DBV15_07473 [Temnothorax longispinosus]
MSFGMSGVRGPCRARGYNARGGDREYRRARVVGNAYLNMPAIVSRIEERWKNAGGCGAPRRKLGKEDKKKKRQLTFYSPPTAANRPSTSRREQKQNSIARRGRPRRMSETPRIPDADRRRLIESIEQHGGSGGGERRWSLLFDKDPDSCVSARGRSAGQNNNKPVRQIRRVQSMMIPGRFLAASATAVALRHRAHSSTLSRRVTATLTGHTRPDRAASTRRAEIAGGSGGEEAFGEKEKEREREREKERERARASVPHGDRVCGVVAVARPTGFGARGAVSHPRARGRRRRHRYPMLEQHEAEIGAPRHEPARTNPREREGGREEESKRGFCKRLCGSRTLRTVARRTINAECG